MEFKDDEIMELDLTDVENFARIITEYLCGERYYKELDESDLDLLRKMMDSIRENGLNYEQFNELMLLLNRERAEEPFFKFFFGEDRISLEQIREGVIKFRGLAMLCFGNFRFAFKKLIAQESEDKLMGNCLRPFCEKSFKLKRKFMKRPPKMLKEESIDRDKTWLLGEIAGEKLKTEQQVLGEKMRENIVPDRKAELIRFNRQLLNMATDGKESQEKALRNTDVYLTWDYMDVYIATSMRNKWEFEETFDFLKKVFETPKLRKLNLRYFDPTQCKCANPRDKGLIEGLMLKRALCTIYMAQETDTMGKDSELAATLAQGTPVIAYVPTYQSESDLKAYSDKIKDYPLDFFKTRLLILDAEGVFRRRQVRQKLGEHFDNFEERISTFMDKLEEYRASQPFSLWFEKDDTEFKPCTEFYHVCKILSIAESWNFDKRADLLRERHPLAMQVDLKPRRFRLANDFRT